MNNSTRVRLSKLALAVAIALGSVSAFAQNTTSAIGGRITGADGKAVAGAQVAIVHTESGSVNNALTDADGRYAAKGLRVGGPYTITITKAGVTEKRENVFLQLAETASVDAKLGGATQAVETIVVTGTNVGSDKFSSTAMGSGSSFGRADLDTFASIQRNLQDYARIDPRISQTDKDRGEISVGGQNTRYNKITIDGVNISDTFGLEANTLPTVKQPISIDAIQSVQVNVSNYDVTQTGYTGGGINAVTKSGTNEIKGSVSYVTRNDDFVGKRYSRATGTYFDPPKLKDETVGFTLGGPIIKDKLFFYVGYEELTSIRNPPSFGPIGSSANNVIGITPSAIASAQALATSQYSMNVGSLDVTRNAELVVKDTLAKLDWNINSSHRASLRYTKTDQTEPQYNNFFSTPSTALSLSSNWHQQVKKIETVVGQWFADWTPTLSTEAKLSSRDYHSEPVTPVNFPEITLGFTGALPPGTPSSVLGGTRNLVFGTERSRHFNILDTKTQDAYFGANWTLGSHEIKAAFDYSDNKIYNAFLQNTKGQYTFSCQNSSPTYTYSFGSIVCANATTALIEAAVFENFTKGRPSSYLVQVPVNPAGSLNDGVSTFNLKNQGFALQDVFSANANLTIQYGVRVDTPIMPTSPLRNAPAGSPTVLGSLTGNTLVRQSGGFGLDNTNTIDGQTLWQPRVGFNYTFDSKRPMQLRGGAGLFQGAAANVWISNIYSNTGVATRVVGCGTQGFAACPAAGGIFNADPTKQITSFAGAAPAANVDFLQPGLDQPSVWKANLAFEHELPWAGIVASVEYLQTWVQTGIYYQHLNLGAPTRISATDGRQMFYTTTGYNPACWTPAGGRTTTGTVCGVDNRTRALNNPGFNDVLVANKTHEGGGRLATVSFSGRVLKDWNWSLSYTYNEAKEVSGLTSSVSNSNWRGRSVLNPNENVASNSDYLVKDRFGATLGWERAFFKGYKTRFGMFYEGRTGKPYSWTFANDANGDGIGGNDLMYIPSAPGSGEVIFLESSTTDKTNENRFWDFVRANPGLLKNAGGVTKRNENFSPWTNNIDVRISQELPSFFKGHKAVFALDILNFGNLLNKKWGRIDEVAFNAFGGLPRQFVNFVGLDPSGKYIYSVPTAVQDFTTKQNRGESQWAMQATFRYEF